MVTFPCLKGFTRRKDDRARAISVVGLGAGAGRTNAGVCRPRTWGYAARSPHEGGGHPEDDEQDQHGEGQPLPEPDVHRRPRLRINMSTFSLLTNQPPTMTTLNPTATDPTPIVHRGPAQSPSRPMSGAPIGVPPRKIAM